MASLFSACTKEDKSVVSANKEVTLVTTLAPTPGISTKTVMNETSDGTISTTWEVGDKIWVKYINTSAVEVTAQATVTSVDGSGNATISVTMTDPKDASTITFGFPYNYWNDDKDLKTGQIGTLDNIKDNYAASSGTGTLTVVGGEATLPTGVTMTPSVCIWKFSFKDGESDITSSVKSLTIHSDISGTVEKYVVTPTSQSNIYVAVSGNANPRFVRITAHTASDTYLKEKSGVTLASGKFYRSSALAMEKVYYISVSASKKVIFAPGNLQYLGNGDGSGSWRFAEHQYDFMGDGPTSGTNYQGNVTVTGFTKYNASADLDVARDLFGWGASGYNNKYPYLTSKSTGSYYSGSTTDTDYDWGVYHSASGNSTEKITNGGSYAWRLFTNEEWAYAIARQGRVYTRDDSPTYQETKDLFASATVMGVKGLIIFPDNWDGKLNRNIKYGNASSAGYTKTIIDAELWAKFEKAGCVFLPAAHSRTGTSMGDLNEGDYWASTTDPSNYNNEHRGCTLHFSSSGTVTKSSGNCSVRYIGQSVRLIREIEID